MGLFSKTMENLKGAIDGLVDPKYKELEKYFASFTFWYLTEDFQKLPIDHQNEFLKTSCIKTDEEKIKAVCFLQGGKIPGRYTIVSDKRVFIKYIGGVGQNLFSDITGIERDFMQVPTLISMSNKTELFSKGWDALNFPKKELLDRMFSIVMNQWNLSKINVPEQSSDTKTCPFCAETIKAQAKVCKHCHKDLNEVSPNEGK